MDRNYHLITIFPKILCFKKAWVAIFAGIIKVVTMFIKTVLKDSELVEF